MTLDRPFDGSKMASTEIVPTEGSKRDHATALERGNVGDHQKRFYANGDGASRFLYDGAYEGATEIDAATPNVFVEHFERGAGLAHLVEHEQAPYFGLF